MPSCPPPAQSAPARPLREETKLADLQTLDLATSGLTVSYYRQGSGEPLLYLHHLMGVVGWEDALDKLSQSFDVIAPFAPGWGPNKDELFEVDKGPLDVTLHNIDLLDALGIQEANVAGIGIGAWMAAELAAIFPARVKKLVVINPTGLWLEDTPGEDPFAQHPMSPTTVLFADPANREKYLVSGMEDIEGAVDEMLNLRAGAKFLWPIPDTGVDKRLGRITAATLIATSEKDAIVPASHGPAWQALIAGSELTTIPGAGHLAELEQPDVVCALIGDFVTSGKVAQLTR